MIKNRKLNPRQERFAQAYVRHGNARKAYLAAGYRGKTGAPNEHTSADSSAGQILHNLAVQTRIEQLKSRARSRHDYTVDVILQELDEARAGALVAQQHGAAVQASTVKARLLGMIVDRKE